MSIIIMLLLISLLILVHELGHFLVARALKIRVDRFGFGLPFGPTLWEKKIGDVTYCIHAFLLGGYVSFPDDDPDSDIPLDDPGRLNNKKVWERALVVSAGVTANALLAFLIVVGVIVTTNGVPTDLNSIYVDGLSDQIKIAKDAGLKAGDKVVAIDDIKINSFLDFKKLLVANKANDGYVSESDFNKQIEAVAKANPKLIKSFGFNPDNLTHVDIKRLSATVIPDNTILNVPKATPEGLLVPDLKDPYSTTDVLPKEAKITEDEKNLKLAIVNNKFAGNAYTTIGEVVNASADTKHLLTLTVERDGNIVNIPISPNSQGIIGIKSRVEDVYTPLTSFGQIFTGAWDYLYSKTALMCMGLYKIFTGQIALWDLHGIVAITKIGGEIIKSRGMVDAWLLTALISIDLAIVNLLPIPALDGGHLLFLFLEKLRGRPVEDKYQEVILKYGFLFLIGLMIFIIFNDILGIVTGKF